MSAMLLDNATLDSVTTPPVPDANGGTTAGTATTPDVRCTIDAPTHRHRYDVGAKIIDITAVVYVMAADLASRPAEGSTLLVTPDDLAQRALLAVVVVDRVHDGQDHFEILCKGSPNT
jgi:hypothetical protein